MTEIIPNSPSGRQLADAGIALAQDHADAEIVAWSDRIMSAFESWLMLQDTAFAIEDFRAHVEARHQTLVPPSPNAWGAVGRMAVRRGLVKFIGYRPARRRCNAQSPCACIPPEGSMSKMPWFRAYTEMVDDEKLRLLAFEDRWHFMAILCLKGQGVLDSADPLMMRKAAVKMGIDVRTLEEVARRLAEVGLIEQATLEPLQWESRQMRSDADNTAADRKRRQREREKEAAKPAEDASQNASHADVTDASRVTSVTVTRTEVDIDTDKEEEKKTTTARARSAAPAAKAHTAADLIALGVDEDIANEFLSIRKRKRAALTPLALTGIRREAGKAGWTLNDALRKAVERGWQSVEAAWLTRDAAPQRQAGTGQFDPLAYVNRNRTSRHQGDSNVIDM